VEADIYMQGVTSRLYKELVDETPANKVLKNESDEVNNPRVEYSILEGKTAESIINFAHSEQIDLLIISTHGSSGLSRWNMSSVTQKVIDMIYLPVLVIRSYNQSEVERTQRSYSRILLPIDSSRRAECSLSAGIALARGEPRKTIKNEKNIVTTKLILAAVIKPPEIPIPEPYPENIEKLSEQLMQVSRQAVNSYLLEMKARLPVESDSYVVENNNVFSAIQELAEQDEAIDLVILCAHGHTGLATWPYGTVTRNYLEQGSKNLLIIQDLPRSKIKPSAAEIAFEKSGGR
jgi:nucleotide-binding universal stress UspA family protein